MRLFLLLPPLAAIGLAGCAGAGVPAASGTMASVAVQPRSATYMSTEQSSAYVTLPGDYNTAVNYGFGAPPYENTINPDSVVISPAPDNATMLPGGQPDTQPPFR